ncbi:MAG: hypothetical protein ACJAZM_000953 [Cyclobacteriaceae bacterium]|jgi:hypothetical protein
MKKLILTSLLVLGASMATFAQSTVINKYFDRFAGDDSYVKVSVSSKMFSLFTELEAGTDEEKEFLDAVAKLKGMKMIVGDSISGGVALYKEAMADVQKAGLEELMMVQDADNQNFQFSIKEKNGIITELMMVSGGQKQFIVMSLFGEIDLKNISKIARSMNVSGLENLEKLDQSSGN